MFHFSFLLATQTPKQPQSPRFKKRPYLLYGILFLMGALFLYKVFYQRTPKEPVEIVNILETKRFGAVDVGAITILQAKKIREVFIELKNTNPQIFAELKQDGIFDDDDLELLTKILEDAGFLLDMHNLTRTLMLLDRIAADSDVREKVTAILCRYLPQLIQCDGKRKDEKEEIKKGYEKIKREMPIEDLDSLTARAYNVLKIQRFHTVEDVLQFMENCRNHKESWHDKMRKFKHCGPATIHAIEKALRDGGYEDQIEDPYMHNN